MPAKKTARDTATRTGNVAESLSSAVTRLQARLEETHARADALHNKAERLHADIDELKEKARNRPPLPNLTRNEKALKRRKAK